MPLLASALAKGTNMIAEATHPVLKQKSSILFLVLFSGLAALSWEVIWQIKSSLALGVSAWGTAMTLAVMMGGMAIGSVASGYLLRKKEFVRPLRIYCGLEIVVGIAGLLLPTAFHLVETMDVEIYRSWSDYAYLFHIAGIVFSLGIPALCFGATLPVIGLMARQYEISVSLLYGLNTLGAAAGTLLTAFFIIPLLGVAATITVVAAVNFIVGAAAFVLDEGKFKAQETYPRAPQTSGLGRGSELFVVFVSGFATFALEVAWFRSFTAAFLSTTAAFSIMLAVVLLSLSLGAWLVSLFRAMKVSLGSLVSLSGILILFATPLVERFDLITSAHSYNPYLLFMYWFNLTFFVIGPPMLLLGTALPWILDSQSAPRKWGMIYGLNTLASILGSICAGWILLPAIGFARTAWLMGALVFVAGIVTANPRKRLIFILLGLLALATAVFFESGVGRKRIQLRTTTDYAVRKILQVYEGPDVTVSAVEHENDERTLVIDGFIATSQASSTDSTMFSQEYMDWMGHLPMLLNPAPSNALVICFGTGQTANAVRKENPQSLDIVEINKQVIKLAPLFKSNEGVLEDPRVNLINMDGRAYLRRTQKMYDVITLEPMPPTFAGVNPLYSKEFYELARARLHKGGVIAQWLPFHLQPPYYSASIAKTFASVFPNSLLWVHPESGTGILLGTSDDDASFGFDFPGFYRTQTRRSLSLDQIKQAVFFARRGMAEYSKYGDEITDDNQLLSYGQSTYMTHGNHEKFPADNQLLIDEVAKEISRPE